MRWESECFFKTYKRVVKDICSGERDDRDGGAGSRGLAAGVPVAAGARGVGVEDGWAAPAATGTSAAPRGYCGRSGGNSRRAPSRCRRRASGVRLQGAGRDRRPRSSAKVRKEHPRRKKHTMPSPPRLKVLSGRVAEGSSSFRLRLTSVSGFPRAWLNIRWPCDHNRLRPLQTGRADFPHPASPNPSVSGMHRESTEVTSATAAGQGAAGGHRTIPLSGSDRGGHSDVSADVVNRSTTYQFSLRKTALG